MNFSRIASSLTFGILLSIATACNNSPDTGASTLAADGASEQCQPASVPPPGYPYSTWQGNEPNCAPRAFETQTGVYDSNLMYGGPVDANGNFAGYIDTGDRGFVGYQPGQVYPDGSIQTATVGDVVYYDYSREEPEVQGHAGICVGYTQDGQCIIATGHESLPYDTRYPGEIYQAYTPVIQ